MINSRTKGKKGELEAAKLWRRWFPKARRSFGQARDGYEQPDINFCDPFFIEVKRVGPAPSKTQRGHWWRKTMNDMEKHRDLTSKDAMEPVLMWRYNSGEWRVRVREDLIYDLLSIEDEDRNQKKTRELPWSAFELAVDKQYPKHGG